MVTKVPRHIRELMNRHDTFYPHRKHKPIPDEELAQRLALIPQDTRDFTARQMGDPIPNDPRRQSCNNTESVNYAESMD